MYLFLHQADSRGVKDPERLKRQQKRIEDAEKEALKHGPSQGGLKVNIIMLINNYLHMTFDLLI